MIPAREALERLVAGNRRFVAGGRTGDALAGDARRREVAAGQEPFAIVLGCSDSRVPAEIVFDQGLGDLFVIRVAGHVVAPSQVGSVEFAAERFGTRLVVVLGHSSCGAVLATLEQLGRPAERRSRNLRSIVDRIRPCVEPLMATELRHRPQALVAEAVRANIRLAASQLRHGSEVLEHLIQEDGLLVVGAEYSLDTGVVEFLDREAWRPPLAGRRPRSSAAPAEASPGTRRGNILTGPRRDAMAEDLETLRLELEQKPSEELISILRNRDEEEWRPEAFGVAADVLKERGISPDEVAAMGPEGYDVVESGPTVTIARFFSPAEAHALRMALEEAGIPAWVADEAGGTSFGIGVGVRLQVRATDEEAARQVLASPPPAPEPETE